MYDSAANTTSNKVNTSIVFIGHHPLFRKTRGYLTSETYIRSFCSIMKVILAHIILKIYNFLSLIIATIWFDAKKRETKWYYTVKARGVTL